jgi:Uma2 family endonuclease
MSTTTLTTVEQFAQMRTAETEDCELVEGELVPLSSATPLHAKVRDLAGDLVRSYFSRNPVGEAFAEIDCRLSQYTVRRPDLSIFLGERSKQFDMNQIPVPFAPDIAEVFVQTDAGMRLLGGKDVVESPLLPGFSHAVADLFVEDRA